MYGKYAICRCRKRRGRHSAYSVWRLSAVICRLDVPTSLRGYLPGTDLGNSIRVGWEPSAGQAQEEQEGADKADEAPQVGPDNIKEGSCKRER
jgi:hypothetical protein